MQNSIHNIEIRPETFSIENVSFWKKRKNIFIEIHENGQIFTVFKNWGIYKCLQIESQYDSESYGILQKISGIFSEHNISIFAFSSINFWYFFFEETFQKEVEIHILHKII